MAPPGISHLRRLEAESIHIIREVAAEFRNPVMLYSIGKDSGVMLHLAMKAFYPSKPPFPLLHVDTTWKFREMIRFRDDTAKRLGLDLIVHVNQDGLSRGINPFDSGSSLHTQVMKTEGLKQALDKYGFDAAFGGARRDEEKSRAKERVFSFRSANHVWDPKNQRPELWHVYNTRVNKGESIRVFPLSNWTELDIWQYTMMENLPIVPLYYAAVRPVVERDGALIMVDDDRMKLKPGEKLQEKLVRFRTLGCYPLTGAIESDATTLEAIVAEMFTARTSERQGRVIDHDEKSSMEKENAGGLFLMSGPVTDLKAYLAAQENKSLLRFLTCGSVDDGKSTLIGRLLYDSKMIFEDQLSALEKDSKKHGTTGDDIDFALLVDGLEAEREQGITIDVAYRFFATDKRKFIVADTPGHEQYTRNMATGASNSELAVILIDARKGVLTQTRRHSYIASLLGIRHVVLAVNKIDLVDFSQDVFDMIVKEFSSFAEQLGFASLMPIPLSARFGDNVISRSAQTPWYAGPALLSHLETIDVESGLAEKPFRMPVQWVNRPNLDFRGFSGTVASGRIGLKDQIVVAGSGRVSTKARVVTMDGDLEEAVSGQAITLTLADEVDISRGDILASASERPEVSDQFAAHVLWMMEEELLPGRQYLLKIGARTVPASVSELKHKIDVNTLDHSAAKTLALNEVGYGNFSLAQPIAFDAYAENRDTGGFILIDRFSNATVGAGMIDFGLRRATNVHWQALDVNKQARAGLKSQKPAVLWFTGLSGSGKSTIANLVERKLFAEGRHTYLLDGDNVRHGLNRDLGFTDADRVENIRRVAETAKLFADSGTIVLVSFISPFRSERRMAREMLEQGEFIEIYVDTPIEICMERDPKGLYEKARAGQIKNFTGIDSPYEAPLAAELVLKTVNNDPEQLSEQVVAHLRVRGLIP